MGDPYHDTGDQRPFTSNPNPVPVPVPVPATSSSAPSFRQALPNASRRATPRLGLAIPSKAGSSPSITSLARPSLPALQVATPSGSQVAPREQQKPQPSRLMTGSQPGYSASGGSESSAAHSRSGSFGPMDGRASIPTSAGSQYSSLSFHSQHGAGIGRGIGTPDPISAAGSIFSERGDAERDGNLKGLDAFDKLTLDRVKELDVEDLDEEGWQITILQKRITELANIGEGSGGSVTKCKLKNGNTLFALKVITSNPDPEARKQNLRELNFNQSCRDPHICRYYGAFEDPSTSTVSIAMEYCEGGSLDSIYSEVGRLGGRTGEKVLGKIASSVLQGLTYLNSKSILHRDIKPNNILLCRNGDVKLCDFGVSGPLTGTKGEANTFIGTSYYMAPERITGQTYTITADVWSLGVTLLEVAQHRFPFPADGTESHPQLGPIDLITYIVNQPTPVLKDEPQNSIVWSDNFKYFVASSLEKDPGRRATPWRMLEHPWIMEMNSKRVNMRRFLSQVWGWDGERETTGRED